MRPRHLIDQALKGVAHIASMASRWTGAKSNRPGPGVEESDTVGTFKVCPRQSPVVRTRMVCSTNHVHLNVLGRLSLSSYDIL